MANATCTAPGCERSMIARKLCAYHYNKWSREGRALPIVTTADRFWPKVNKCGPVPGYAPHLGPCWVWVAGKNGDGYGTFQADGRVQGAHRVAYELLVGPVPEGLELDHLCRVPACVNPVHLDPVTPPENSARSPIYNGSKTHCKRGHPFDDANTRHGRGSRRRICKTCEGDAQRRYKQRRRSSIT